jgi:hypothetical protein
MFDAYVGTTSGGFRLRDDALEALGLEAERVSAIHAWREGDAVVVLAGSYGNGLFRSADGGRTWSTVDAGLTESAFRHRARVMTRALARVASRPGQGSYVSSATGSVGL